MGVDWRRCLLGDLIELKRGYDLPTHQRLDGEYPIVSSSGISGTHVEAKVRGPGVVTGRYGTLGEVFYVPTDFWPLNTSLYVQDFKGNEPRFITYLLKALDLGTRNAAGAVPGVNRNHLHQLPVLAPDPHLQRRIAAILSAYDDLIENNARRIAILEEMARRLYEEWFVHFRFPGHDEARFQETDLGKVPHGWEVKTAGSTFEVVGGGTPSKNEPAYWEGGEINWYAPTDLTRAGTSFMVGSSTRITELGLRRSSARLFSPRSVMMTSRATIGTIAINTTDACTNQGFITCLPNKDFPLFFLFHWLHENVDNFISLGTGATFKEITKGTFKTIQLIVPPRGCTQRFEMTVAPMMEQVLVLQCKNANLRAQRDLLLPKLVSGEIDVSQAPAPDEAVVAA